MVIKLFALSPWGYVSEAYNRLDCFIVSASMLELILGSSGTISVFRVLRLLRIARTLRLVRGLGSIRKVVETAFDSIADVGNFVFLLLLLLFMFALLGMNIFGGRFDSIGDGRDEDEVISGSFTVRGSHCRLPGPTLTPSGTPSSPCFRSSPKRVGRPS